MPGITRRGLIGGGAAFCATRGRAEAVLRFALTPVIFDNDADAAETLRAALAAASGQTIKLVRRRSYAEITALLLEGSVEAAWLCGYPYLQHRAELALLGVRSGGADCAINPVRSPPRAIRRAALPIWRRRKTSTGWT